jgi:hypothetical protein
MAQSNGSLAAPSSPQAASRAARQRVVSLLGREAGGAFGEFIGGALEDEEQQARQPAPVQVINPPEANFSRFLGTVRLVLGFDQDGLLKLISILGQDRIFWCGRAGVFSELAL